ncbi:unnamed protein product [Discosporangium mesarthrocarpum]
MANAHVDSPAQPSVADTNLRDDTEANNGMGICSTFRRMRTDEVVAQVANAPDDEVHSKLVLLLKGGSEERFLKVFRSFSTSRVKNLLTLMDSEDMNLLMHAAQAGNQNIFSIIITAMWKELSTTEILLQLGARSRRGVTPLMYAIEGGNPDVFQAVVEAVMVLDNARAKEAIAQGVPVLDQARVDEFISLDAPVPDGDLSKNGHNVHLTELGSVATVTSSNMPVCVFALLSNGDKGGSENFGSVQLGNYFEVTIINPGMVYSGVGLCYGAVGLACPGALPVARQMPGWMPGSYGYHGDGKLYRGNGSIDRVSDCWGFNDVIGCGFSREKSSIWYTRNGKLLEHKFTDVSEASLIPVVGLRYSKSIAVNFGLKDFKYKGPEVWIAEAVLKERDLRMHADREAGGADLCTDVVSKLVEKDEEERSLLLLAAHCAEPRMYEVVLRTLRANLTDVKYLKEFTAESSDNATLLKHAESSSVDMVSAVQKSLETTQEIVRERGFLLRVSSTANVGEIPGLFHAIKELLPDPQQVVQCLQDMAEEGTSLLMHGSVSCDKTEFSNMVEILRGVISETEVVRQMMATPKGSKVTLLMQAAVGAQDDAFEGILNKILEQVDRASLPISQVEGSLMAKDATGLTLLLFTAKFGGVARLRNVLKVLKEKRFHERRIISQTQVVEQLIPSTTSGKTLLMQVVLSSEENAFNDALDILLEELNLLWQDEEGALDILLEELNIMWQDKEGSKKKTEGLLYQVVEKLLSREEDGMNLIAFTARYGGGAKFSNVLGSLEGKFLSHSQVKEQLAVPSTSGWTLLMYASVCGDHSSLQEVMRRLRNYPEQSTTQVKTQLRIKDRRGMSFLMYIVRYGGSKAFSRALDCLKRELEDEQFAAELMHADHEGATTLMYIAAQDGWSAKDIDVLLNELRRLHKHYLDQRQSLDQSTQVTKHLKTRTERDLNAVMIAARHGNVNSFKSLLDFASSLGFDLDATSAVYKQRKSAIHLAAERRDGAWLDMVGALVQHGAVPSPQFVIALVRKALEETDFSEHSIIECFLRAIASAPNPLIPGVNVSTALGNADLKGPEMHSAVSEIRQAVNELVRKVMKEMPQTVRTMPETRKEIMRGVRGVEWILEPEWDLEPNSDSSRQRPVMGPLHKAVRGRHLDFFSTPLVLDFLLLKFGCGLPGILQVWSTPDDQEEGFLDTHRLLLGDHWFDVHVQGRGADADESSITFSPGGQFVLAGLAARSTAYYSVPSVRMMFEFFVSLYNLVLFTTDVIQTEEERLGQGEIAFFIYVWGSVFSEVRQMREFSLRHYFSDLWNQMDILILLLLTSASVSRLVAVTQGPKIRGGTEWDAQFVAKLLFAICAPLLFSRILFYFQIFRKQGPMIQVIFRMLWLLVNFGVLMVVVMQGFAAAFLGLFPSLELFTSFDNALLTLFRAMLGDFDFDEFSDLPNAQQNVGIALMVVYLVVMAVTLINLLIAVIVTEHRKVHDDIEREFWLSYATMILNYESVIEHHFLPAPFNIIQGALASAIVLVRYCCCGFQDQRKKDMKEFRCGVDERVGKFVFWLFMGPVAVMGSALLWVVSLPKVVFVVLSMWVTKSSRFWYTNKAKVEFSIRAPLLCLGGAPLYLSAKWLWSLCRQDELGVFRCPLVQRLSNGLMSLLALSHNGGTRSSQRGIRQMGTHTKRGETKADRRTKHLKAIFKEGRVKDLAEQVLEKTRGPSSTTIQPNDNVWPHVEERLAAMEMELEKSLNDVRTVLGKLRVIPEEN